MKRMKKTFTFMVCFTVLLFSISLTIWLTSDSPMFSLMRSLNIKGTHKAPSGDSKFRIFLDGKLLIEEDFTNRPQDTIFKQLRLNRTVRVDKEHIGVLHPISSEGPANKFPLDVIFRPTISQTDKILVLYLFQKFIELCTRNNITYFLQDGSLIGSYRHHGLIPWDDDVDVFVNGTQKDLLAQVSAKVPGFKIFTKEHFQWKFFHRNLSTNIRENKFRWPYIDIFFWDTNSTHLYDVTHRRRGASYKLTFVFPLRPRPFEGAYLNCPLRTGEFLRKKYNIRKCITNTYSHRYESGTRWYKTVPCSKLEYIYPFVKKQPRRTFCKENLVHKGKIIQTFTFENC